MHGLTRRSRVVRRRPDLRGSCSVTTAPDADVSGILTMWGKRPQGARIVCAQNDRWANAAGGCSVPVVRRNIRRDLEALAKLLGGQPFNDDDLCPGRGGDRVRARPKRRGDRSQMPRARRRLRPRWSCVTAGLPGRRPVGPRNCFDRRCPPGIQGTHTLYLDARRAHEVRGGRSVTPPTPRSLTRRTCGRSPAGPAIDRSRARSGRSPRGSRAQRDRAGSARSRSGRTPPPCP